MVVKLYFGDQLAKEASHLLFQTIEIRAQTQPRIRIPYSEQNTIYFDP